MRKIPTTLKNYTFADLTRTNADSGHSNTVINNPYSTYRPSDISYSMPSMPLMPSIEQQQKMIAIKPIEAEPIRTYTEINPSQIPDADVKPKTASVDYTYWLIGGGAVLALGLLIYFSSK